MSKATIIFIGILFAVLVLLAGKKHRRDRIIEDARRASVALAAAGDAVQFDWKYEACPPENSGVYTEWTRRFADAKALSSHAAAALGADDPDVQLFAAGIFNQKMVLDERRIACLKRQGEVLDRIRAAHAAN